MDPTSSQAAKPTSSYQPTKPTSQPAAKQPTSSQAAKPAAKPAKAAKAGSQRRLSNPLEEDEEDSEDSEDSTGSPPATPLSPLTPVSQRLTAFLSPASPASPESAATIDLDLDGSTSPRPGAFISDGDDDQDFEQFAHYYNIAAPRRKNATPPHHPDGDAPTYQLPRKRARRKHDVSLIAVEDGLPVLGAAKRDKTSPVSPILLPLPVPEPEYHPVAAVVGGTAEHFELWYVVVMKLLKTTLTGQFLEVDADSPGGFTLHQESSSLPIKLHMLSFGPLEFTKTSTGVLMLAQPLPVSGVLEAEKALAAYIAA